MSGNFRQIPHLTDENLFGNDLSARLAELKKDMHTAGSRGMLEVNAGNDRVFQFQVHSTFNQTDQVVMKTTIREVTAERRREQLLRSLLREVSHRSKNLLAIIQSLAGQTARFSLTKDDFLRKFRGGCTLLPKVRISSRIQTGGVRVYSVRCASNLIFTCRNIRTSSIWKGRTFSSTRMVRSISDLRSMSLVVNTVSHSGNLAYHPPITLQCRQEGDFYVVEWNEPMMPSKEPAEARRGSFGSVVLEKVVPSALGKRRVSVDARTDRLPAEISLRRQRGRLKSVCSSKSRV